MRKITLMTLPLMALALTSCEIRAQHDAAADRAAIHELLMDYGRTLDEGDFDGFADLFADGGTYNGTPGSEAGTMMRGIFAENRLGLPDPKFHMFFNEVTTLDGPDSAHSTSMSFYIAPNKDNRPEPVMMARYQDELVREDDGWKFKSRQVQGLIPPPIPPTS